MAAAPSTPQAPSPASAAAAAAAAQQQSAQAKAQQVVRGFHLASANGNAASSEAGGSNGGTAAYPHAASSSVGILPLDDVDSEMKDAEGILVSRIPPSTTSTAQGSVSTTLGVGLLHNHHHPSPTTPPDGQGITYPPLAMLKKEPTSSSAASSSASSSTRSATDASAGANASATARGPIPMPMPMPMSTQQMPMRFVGTPSPSSAASSSSFLHQQQQQAYQPSHLSHSYQRYNQPGAGAGSFGTSAASLSFGTPTTTGSYGSSGAYRTTSFQTSAERAGAAAAAAAASSSATTPGSELNGEHGEELDGRDMMVQAYGDVGGEYDGGLLFEHDEHHNQQQLQEASRMNVDEEHPMKQKSKTLHDEQDAGVFSFSSPYLQSSKELQDPSQQQQQQQQQQAKQAGDTLQRPPPAGMLSPSFAAATLSKMSISGGPSSSSSSGQTGPASASAQRITGRGANLLSSSFPSSFSPPGYYSAGGAGASAGQSGIGAQRRRTSHTNRSPFAVASSSSATSYSPSSSGWVNSSIFGTSAPLAGSAFQPVGAGASRRSRSRSRNRTLLASAFDKKQQQQQRHQAQPSSSPVKENAADDETDDDATEDESDMMRGLQTNASGMYVHEAAAVPAGVAGRRRTSAATSFSSSPNGTAGRSAGGNGFVPGVESGSFTARRTSRGSLSSSPALGVGVSNPTSLGLHLGPDSPKSALPADGGDAQQQRSPLAPVTLSRQYSAERHLHHHHALAANRHHPYAASPSSNSGIAAVAGGSISGSPVTSAVSTIGTASPRSVGVALGGSAATNNKAVGGAVAIPGSAAASSSTFGTSPAGSTGGFHRRGSSLASQPPGSQHSQQQLVGSAGGTSFLSQSPRYGGLHTLSTRELPPGVYSEQQAAAVMPSSSSFVGSLGSSASSNFSLSRSPHTHGVHGLARFGGKAPPPSAGSGASAFGVDEEETDDDLPTGSSEEEDEILDEEDEEDLEATDEERDMLDQQMDEEADNGTADASTSTTRSGRRVVAVDRSSGTLKTSSLSRRAEQNGSKRRSSSRTRAPPKVNPGGTLEEGGDEALEVAAIRERLGGAANCSAFISKLWYLMINPELYSRYIHWSEAGDAIVISNDPDLSNEFAADVLPKLFKHGNNASFVRQLNLYGFQRIASNRPLDSIETKVAKARGLSLANGANAQALYGSHSSFSHPRFLRGKEELLPSMKPRSSKKPKKASAAGSSSHRRRGISAASDDEDDE